MVRTIISIIIGILTIVMLGNGLIPTLSSQVVKSISFKEDLSIGVRDGDENYMFGNTIMVNADSGGNIYVTDWDRKQIRKYDRQGKYLLTMGQKGQGPGEFANISVARFDQAGNIYALDFASRKIVFFDLNGKFLNQRQINEQFADLQWTPAGTYVGIQSKLSEIAGIPQFVRKYGIFDDQFKAIVEFYSAAIPPPPPPLPNPNPRALAEDLSKSIFQPDPFYAMGSDGQIFYGYSDKYVIHVYSPEGAKLRTISRDCEPLKIEKKDEDDFFENEWSTYLRYLAETIRNQVKQHIHFPKNKPFFQRLAPMENGWLVVVVDAERGKSILFDLFDKDGRFIARMRGLVPNKNLFFKNGKAYAVKEDDGYQFVKRYSYEIR